MNFKVTKTLIVSAATLALSSTAFADSSEFCITKQAPKSYEKYNGAIASVVITQNVSAKVTIHFATGGKKVYTLPFLFNDMYSNEDTFVSVSFRNNGKEIYFSNPDQNDWFSADLCG